MQWTLAFGGGVSMVAAGAYAYAASRFAGKAHGVAGSATAAFSGFWACLAAYTAAQGGEDLLGAIGWTPVALFVALRYASLPVLLTGFGGLVYYVLYVRTGNARWRGPAYGYYIVLSVALLALIAQGAPDGVSVQRWRTDVTYSGATNGPMLGVVLLLVSAPAIAAIGSYLTLARRAHDATMRRRILVVGTGLLLWVVAMVVSRASNDDLFQLLARPTLGAGVAVVVAFALRERKTLNGSGASSAR